MAIDETDEDSLWVLPGPHPEAPADSAGSASQVGRDPSPAGNDTQPRTVLGTTIRTGDLLAGRFEIGNTIGQGGMGTVYEARDTLRDEAIAIKVLVPGLLQDEEAIRQFQSEAAIAMRLSHPHVVTVYDFQANDGGHAIVMERLRGKTLREEINERKSSGIAFATADIEGILGPVCQALDYAHGFTVHRDVKPENIWIGDDGTVKLMDFGLAMLVQRGAAPLTQHTLSQLRLGSPYYMAPEQLQDARRASAASDQFGVGVIAYELFSGALPMGLAKPLRELRPDLPYALTGAVDRALANDPQTRFPSVAAFWEGFRTGCHRRRSWRQHLDNRPVLRKSALGAAVVGVLALLTGLGFSVVSQRATTLLSKTGDASNALQAARLEVSAVRQLVDELQRTHLNAEFELKAVRGKEVSDAGDVPAILEHEIEIARAEKKFGEAERARRMLEPRLRDERTPITLTNGMAALEETLRAHDFRGFARARTLLEDEIVNERKVIARINALAAAQLTVAALNLADADGKAIATTGQDTEVSSLSNADLEESLVASLALEEELAERIDGQFEELEAAHRKAAARWQALFPKTGPPPIEFLGHPTAKAEAAGGWRSLARYDRAIPLLTDATATLNGWAKEVEDLHARCDDMWTKAQAEGRAFENVLGMRFVRIEDGDSANYWSIWETRVMDFAWFVSNDGFGSENAGTFWKDPGFPIGPTYPVLGIEPDLAGEFGRWIVPHFQGTDHEGTYGLPTIEMYEAMLAREPAWRMASVGKRAVFPDNNRLRSRHWMNEWADPDISPEQHIRPVGFGEPSAQGLHGLFGNAWEWANDLLSSKRGANHHGRDYQFLVLYGGGSFGQISFNGYEPLAGHRFVGRHDALGFRFTIPASTIQRLRNEENRSEDSPSASP